MDFRPLIQSDAIRPENDMMIGRRHVDVPGLNGSAVLNESRRVLPLLLNSCGSMLRLAPICTTTKIAAEHGTGNAAMMRRRGSRPPADAACTRAVRAARAGRANPATDAPAPREPVGATTAG
jgi:hypothetical protein